MKYMSAALAGLLFGMGLTISGMVNPVVVLGFLDLAGDWNPALLFVMIGALLVSLPGYWLLKGRKPLFAVEQMVPTRRDIDWPLITGAVLFGIGWGIAGICPGPSFALFGIKPVSAAIFVTAMTGGMFLARLVVQR